MLLLLVWFGTDTVISTTATTTTSFSAVLISHPDMKHLGALPYAVGKLGLCAPVYITGAGHKMGQMCAYDAFLLHHAGHETTPFDLDDVDKAFGGMKQLRYRQETMLFEGRQADGERQKRLQRMKITVTPYPAGHLIGGAMWKISVHGNELIYAVDYNHRRERHLNGMLLESLFSRPSLLITDAWNMDRVPVNAERNENMLIETCLRCLRSEGNVLIPVDAAGRVLELLLILNKYWNEKRLTYPLAVVGPMVHTTLDFARSQLEWMNESLVNSLGHSKDNPLSLRCVVPCTSMKEVKKLPRGPKVVLATSSSMNDGASRQLFSWWGLHSYNTIIFAMEPEDGTLAAEILNAAAERDIAPSGVPLPTIQYNISKRVPLQGEELEKYNRQQEERKKQEKEKKQQEEKLMEHPGSEIGSPEGKTLDSEDGGYQTKGHHTMTRSNVAVIGHAIRDEVGVLDSVGEQALVGDQDMDLDDTACLIEGFEVPMGVAAPMFPNEDEREGLEYDEYGAALDLDQFDVDRGLAGGSLGRALASEAAAERYAEGGEDQAGDAVLEPEVPTKIETKAVVTPLAAQVLRIDFDGRSDAQSTETMLSHVAPRSLVLVHGTEACTTKLASRLMDELGSLHSAIYAPRTGETLSIDVGPSYSTVVSDDLLSSIEMHPIGDYELGWINGAIALNGGNIHGEDTDIVLSKSAHATQIGAYGGIFIGDVKLSQLKRALTSAGIGSEFHAGGLYCDGNILVKRRGEGGGLVLEGSMCDTYFKIRDIVYSQYHVC